MNNEFYLDYENDIEFYNEVRANGRKFGESVNELITGTKSAHDKGFLTETSNIAKDCGTGGDGLSGDSATFAINYTNNSRDLENSFTKAIDNMSIFTDLMAENAAEVNYYNGVLLEKIDGRSVKDGKTTEKANETDDSQVVREALDNINDNVTQQQNLDDSSTIVGQSILGNINGNTTAKQELNDETRNISSADVRNINGNTTQKQSLDGSSQISSEMLGNVNGNTTQKQVADTTSSIVGESLLGNVSGNNPTQKQELEDKNIAAAVSDVVAANDANSKHEKDEDEDNKTNELYELNNNSMEEDK